MVEGATLVTVLRHGAVAGPGTGLDGAGVRHKAEVIDRGLALHGFAPPFAKGGPGGISGVAPTQTEQIPPNPPLVKGGAVDLAHAALRTLGGFEIAALTGAYIACAQQGLPALVDGFLTNSGALA